MTDVITGDTVDFSNTDFTILTYIDSAGCTGCLMKLPLWNKFLYSLDSITAADTEINAVIVVNGKDNRELSYIIKRDDYQYHVINDINDSLQRINRFPDNPMFRSFLLDKHNCVVAIGNPVYNHAVADLYRSVISGCRTFSKSGSQMIAVNNTKYSIGDVSLGECRTCNFLLYNESDSIVTIKDIVSSCHCTEAIVSDSIIPSGVHFPIQITFREDSVIGDFIRTVNIFYHGFENPTILEISGTVIK